MISRIGQAVKDLKCVGPGELYYRTWDGVLRASGLYKKIHKPGWMSDEAVLEQFGGRFTSRADICHYLRLRKNVRFFFLPEDRDLYSQVLNKVFCQERETLLHAAEKVLEHQFELLGCEYAFDGDIDWHYAGEGKRWPQVHWSKLQIGDGYGLGDIRPLWELNRHQHFYVLGRAYWWTGDERYAQEFVRQIKSWLRDNPPEVGVNWQSNLEIAIRSISWLWAYHFVLRAEVLDDDTLFELVRAFVHSAYHLERHLSYSWYCMRNNHLIGDATGLALIAQTFPELVRARTWKRTALKILYGELPRQVYADGVNWEQAVYYHRFVLYLYLQVVRMEQLNGGNVPSWVWPYLEKMFEFLCWVAKPDGRAPLVGDNDNGVAVWLGNEDVVDMRPALATGAVLFGRGDLKYAAGCLAEETLWLLGLDAVERWNRIKTQPLSDTLGVFDNGGFYVKRSGWEPGDTYLLFKNGPHSMYHSHADQLHIELAAHGHDLLIDPGTYVYNSEPQWRNFFRGTVAHNTVVVDGESQSVPHRSFRWLETAEPLEVDVCAGEHLQWVCGGHTGYQRLADPVIHRRGVMSVLGEYVVVFDDFTARDEHHYEFCFHFPPGVAEVSGLGCQYRRDDGAAGLVIRPIDTDGMNFDIVQGREEPEIQGWVSYRYGVREPAPVFCARGRKSGAWVTGFLLWPLGPETREPKAVECKVVSDEPKVLRISHGHFVDLVAYSGEETPMRLLGRGLSTDAGVVFYRSDTDGKLSCLMVMKGTEVSVDDLFSLAGDWRYLELGLDGNRRDAFLQGDVSGEVVLNSGVIENLAVGDGLEVRRTTAEVWVIGKQTG